ncbi:thioredoxin reductase 1, cytoplasmic isoform X1 [Rousettus aegyptiacus]|uniref:thioredoxin reductase 1, cytoplasmic isoform X1 n=1 Tax=Rousettus aegyptiacus TaxID=9407 RepID=UPI00168D526A|nr:thioredoxin reductase 1, cytoplasmic isoform X1 [Rousettus aegyptiacus]XP_036093273.1 thioredoxin reductase 1, cytoplasmic isoform X1 [Rousettus aegyptiacus]XP_036093274.1 thioredoxin reductase 1, cytoplasmic isoform X1 [Rousettus aegyptiacus]
MPVDEYWLCLPASHVRPFVQTVRVTQSRPHCCWLPGVLPSVPEPSCVPAVLPRGSHSAAPPPPPSTAPPSTPQTSCPADPKLCLSSPTSGGSQEKNVQSRRAYQEGRLQKLLTMNGSEDHPKSYDYDLIIIGGGSGGLAAAKEAAKFNKKVMVLDFVTPTPLGTRWGLGGTCVNVGCIPKKLMHQAALLGQALRDSRNYGWTVEETVKHDWDKMTEAVQNHIGSLNWGYRVALREKKVTYENAYGQFVGPHRIKATNNKGREKIYSAERFLIATGERPRYLGIPGDKEYCISSDDLFSLPYCPGKTLVVGASYVALECAGFLAGIGLDVTVMVRSILLRGFDQDMANKIGEHMEEHGVKFIKQFVPIKVEQIEAGAPGRLRVVAKSTNSDEIIKEEYNTVLLAIGRDACTRKIGLETVGVKINEKTGKIPVTDEEQTNVPYIYAIGDILEGKLELTPVAIQAGRLLAQRLYGGSSVKCDYENVPTTVFTPLEYGACGLSEEKAVEKFGEENVEVYHSYFWPLEWTIPSRDNNKCYAKVVCNMKDNERVVGFHVLGPNAGEVTQGFAAALKCGLTKKQLDSTIGIHPVCAEVFTTLSVTKRSGGSILQTGC